MPRANETRVIRITADTRGNRELKRMAKDMGLLNKNVSSMSKSFSFLRNATIAWFGAMQVGELVRMSDTMQLLGDRIEVLTDGQADAYETLVQLREVADSTQTSLNVTADSFTRMAAAIGDSRIETKSLIGLTKVLQDSFLVAGASLKETQATVVQLAQAFASGEVRGQELRSVMEQNATIAKLLREEYGKDIYKQAATGAIRAIDVIKILIKNQDDLARKAGAIKPTIEKTIVAALNGLRLTIFELNKEYAISTKFASFLETAIDKLSLAFVALGVAAIPLVAKAIFVSLIPAVVTLGKTLIALTLTNPFTALAAGIGIAVFLIFKNLDALKGRFAQFRATLLDIRKAFLEFKKKFIGSDPKFKKDIEAVNKEINSLTKRAKDYRKEAEKLLASNEKKNKGGLLDADFLKQLQSIYGQTVTKLAAGIQALNKSFSAGEITTGQYVKRLNELKIQDLNQQFKDGKVDLEQYNQQLATLRFENLNNELNKGVINLDAFRNAVNDAKFEQLKNQLDSGKISLQEFNKEALKLKETFDFFSSADYLEALDVGVNEYLLSLATTGQQISETIKKSFGSLENELLNFVKTGKFEFKRFAQSILDDLTRIIIRMQIIGPIAQSIAGGFGGVSAGASVGDAGAGGFGSSIQPFARGGVVSSPTLFNYGSKTGVMGEAGAEAILPLTRKNGDLGVQASVTPVNINIVNNTDSTIEASETFGANGERNIEFLIEAKVKEGFSKGAYDKPLKSNFGIKRRGY